MLISPCPFAFTQRPRELSSLSWCLLSGKVPATSFPRRESRYSCNVGYSFSRQQSSLAESPRAPQNIYRPHLSPHCRSHLGVYASPRSGRPKVVCPSALLARIFRPPTFLCLRLSAAPFCFLTGKVSPQACHSLERSRGGSHPLPLSASRLAIPAQSST